MGRTASEELFSLQGQPDHEYFDVAILHVLILTVTVTCGTCSGVAILTTLVRIAVRMRRQSRFWVDDVSAFIMALQSSYEFEKRVGTSYVQLSRTDNSICRPQS
jgi:hypothetical protein